MSTNMSSLEMANITTAYSSLYQLDISLLLLVSIGSTIGLIFNIMCIVRYCRYSSLRTHFTYVFHFILIYCLLASIFINPSLLIGYFGYIFVHSRTYCQIYGVIGSLMYVGIAYSLLFVSIERHQLTFRKNGLLTLTRQLVPMGVLFTFSLVTAAGFFLIPTCPYVPCISCSASNLKLLIIWQFFSFFFPVCCLILSTFILIIRVRIQRQYLRHHRQPNRFRPSKKITIHMCIYVVWGLVYYSPPALYNLLTTLNPVQFTSPAMKSISSIIGILGIQVYPVLTYVMFWRHRRNRRNMSRIKPRLTVATIHT